MCGIVGIIGHPGTQVAEALLTGLQALEYRGYDSAGLAILSPESSLQRHRAAGKLVHLQNLQVQNPLKGSLGIGHTRWATHGIPNESNAHPHMTERVALVHNGIIENHHTFHSSLEAQGVHFSSQTDSEVVLHLIDQALQQQLSPREAVLTTLNKITGAYAFALVFRDYPDLLIGVRHGPPLVIGYGKSGMYLGSDALAVSHLTSELSYLEDGDMAVLKSDSADIYRLNGEHVQRPKVQVFQDSHLISKGPYSHFMAKEIHEQPEVIRQTLDKYFNEEKNNLIPLNLPFKWQDIDRLTVVACGTAYYAGLIAKYWFESIARISVEVDIASEFRYRTPPMASGQVALFISQSGETADTLAAHSYAASQHQHCVAVVNVKGSTLYRTADYVCATYAGPEIGVASTKAFTTQLSVLAILALEAAQQRRTISEEEFQAHCTSLKCLPALMEEFLPFEPQCQEISYHISKAQDVLYLGRGTSYAIALEGALKLKEVSYIHAEGYAAGELKHGPIALIDDKVPVVVIAPSDNVFEKTISNVQEVTARKGKIILISDEIGHMNTSDLKNITRLILPTVSSFTSPLLYTLPIQLLAYHTAVIKGTDVDQPRNLAKSVTVE